MLWEQLQQDLNQVGWTSELIRTHEQLVIQQPRPGHSAHLLLQRDNQPLPANQLPHHRALLIDILNQTYGTSPTHAYQRLSDLLRHLRLLEDAEVDAQRTRDRAWREGIGPDGYPLTPQARKQDP